MASDPRPAARRAPVEGPAVRPRLGLTLWFSPLAFAAFLAWDWAGSLNGWPGAARPALPALVPLVVAGFVVDNRRLYRRPWLLVAGALAVGGLLWWGDLTVLP